MGRGPDKKITKEQQREFWKHGINPIIGRKYKGMNYEPETKNNSCCKEPDISIIVTEAFDIHEETKAMCNKCGKEINNL